MGGMDGGTSASLDLMDSPSVQLGGEPMTTDRDTTVLDDRPAAAV